MTAREILRLLKRVRPSGGGWTAACPAHSDSTPSLSIRESAGRVLLHCHAGCSPEAIVAALGLEMADLFTQPKNAPPRIVMTYPYIDEHGKLLFEVVRFDPKGFKQRRPDGRGGWHWNLNGTRRVLYNLPSVIASDSVLVCEGEKDCECARRLGFVATCNPGGAGKWRREYSEYLRGKRVVIVPDGDEPGRKHARDVACSLVGLAEFVKIVELPSGKDLSDWAQPLGAGTKEVLQALADATLNLTPLDFEPASRVIGVLASQVKPEPIRWFWKNRIALGKVHVWDGDPGLGKSLVSVDLAARASAGAAMPDEDSPSGREPVGVVIMSAEDGFADTVVPRLKSAGADLARVRLIPAILDLETGLALSIPADLSALELAIKSVHAQLVIIDPLVAFIGTATNSWKDQDIRHALAPLSLLAERTGAAHVAIRHLSKVSSPNPLYRGGGSIGIIGAARIGFLFARNPEDSQSIVFAATKSNVGVMPGSLLYRISVNAENIPVVEWQGKSHLDATTLLSSQPLVSGDEPAALTEAMSFLRDSLEDGPKPSKVVKQEAHGAGVANRTLDRAKVALKVRSSKCGFDGSWNWSLPEI